MAVVIYCGTSNNESKAEGQPSALTRWAAHHVGQIARERLDVAGVSGHQEMLDDLLDAAEEGRCHILAVPDLHDLTLDPRVIVQLVREIGALGVGGYAHQDDGRHSEPM